MFRQASFRMIAERWASTVLGEIDSLVAMLFVVRPIATRRATFSSAWVSSGFDKMGSPFGRHPRAARGARDQLEAHLSKVSPSQ
jgi:hypothetical protein